MPRSSSPVAPPIWPPSRGSATPAWPASSSESRCSPGPSTSPLPWRLPHDPGPAASPQPVRPGGRRARRGGRHRRRLHRLRRELAEADVAATASPPPVDAAPSARAPVDRRRTTANCPTSQPAPMPAGEKRDRDHRDLARADRRSRSTARSRAERRRQLRRPGRMRLLRRRRLPSPRAGLRHPGRRRRSTAASSRTGARRPCRPGGGPGYTIQDEPVTATYGRGTWRWPDVGPNTNGVAVLHRARGRRSCSPDNTTRIFGHGDVGHGRRRRDRRDAEQWRERQSRPPARGHHERRPSAR